jgi:hypothetical protein
VRNNSTLSKQEGASPRGEATPTCGYNCISAARGHGPSLAPHQHAAAETELGNRRAYDAAGRREHKTPVNQDARTPPAASTGGRPAGQRAAAGVTHAAAAAARVLLMPPHSHYAHDNTALSKHRRVADRPMSSRLTKAAPLHTHTHSCACVRSWHVVSRDVACGRLRAVGHRSACSTCKAGRQGSAGQAGQRRPLPEQSGGVQTQPTCPPAP